MNNTTSPKDSFSKLKKPPQVPKPGVSPRSQPNMLPPPPQTLISSLKPPPQKPKSDAPSTPPNVKMERAKYSFPPPTQLVKPPVPTNPNPIPTPKRSQPLAPLSASLAAKQSNPLIPIPPPRGLTNTDDMILPQPQKITEGKMRRSSCVIPRQNTLNEYGEAIKRENQLGMEEENIENEVKQLRHKKRSLTKQRDALINKSATITESVKTLELQLRNETVFIKNLHEEKNALQRKCKEQQLYLEKISNAQQTRKQNIEKEITKMKELLANEFEYCITVKRHNEELSYALSEFQRDFQTEQSTLNSQEQKLQDDIEKMYRGVSRETKLSEADSGTTTNPTSDTEDEDSYSESGEKEDEDNIDGSNPYHLS